MTARISSFNDGYTFADLPSGAIRHGWERISRQEAVTDAEEEELFRIVGNLDINSVRAWTWEFTRFTKKWVRGWEKRWVSEAAVGKRVC